MSEEKDVKIEDTSTEENKDTSAEEVKEEADTSKEETKKENAVAEDKPAEEPASTSNVADANAASQKDMKAEGKEEISDEEIGQDIEIPDKFKALVEQIEEMPVLELNELVKLLEKKFGVSAAAVAVAGAGAGDGDAEEKSEFDIELTSDGGAKIPVMKVVKELLGLGLKEAKEMVEGAPTVLKTGAKKEEAEEMKKKIEEAGGQVNLK